ncbi:MAG: hypothetical protein ACFFBE_09250 [Promethearchaeota archaeon]
MPRNRYSDPETATVAATGCIVGSLCPYLNVKSRSVHGRVLDCKKNNI